VDISETTVLQHDATSTGPYLDRSTAFKRSRASNRAPPPAPPPALPPPPPPAVAMEEDNELTMATQLGDSPPPSQDTPLGDSPPHSPSVDPPAAKKVRVGVWSYLTSDE
jgi:hypothetical protein